MWSGGGNTGRLCPDIVYLPLAQTFPESEYANTLPCYIEMEETATSIDQKRNFEAAKTVHGAVLQATRNMVM